MANSAAATTVKPGTRSPFGAIVPPNASDPVDANASDLMVGRRLRDLRQRSHLPMRQLAEKAGVSVGYISGVESGRISATLATLRKLLLALGTDIGPFFSTPVAPVTGHVFRREAKRSVSDAGRTLTMLLPPRADIKMFLLDEELFPGEQPEFEAMPGDFGGYVVSGELLLEVKGEDAQVLRVGDSFHVEAGKPLRGRSVGDLPVRVVSVQLVPPALAEAAPEPV